MPASANFQTSPISASNIANFSIDVANIAAQQGGGTGLVYVSVTDGITGTGIVGDPLLLKDNQQHVSVTLTDYASGNHAYFNDLSASQITGAFNGDGCKITNITASNIPNFTSDVRAQHSAGTNLTYTTGTYALNDTISLSSVSASLNGNGSQVTSITASNISNFTADVRKQISGSQYISYNNSSGVVSLPFTGSTVGTAALILGQTIASLTGLSDISSTNITGSLYANKLTLAPSGIQTISNITTAIAPTGPFHRITLNSNITLSTSIAQIIWPSANTGDILMVHNVINSGGDLTLNRGSTTKLSLAGATVKLSQGGTVIFIYDGTFWIELAVLAGTSAP